MLCLAKSIDSLSACRRKSFIPYLIADRDTLMVRMSLINNLVDELELGCFLVSLILLIKN